MPLPLVGREYAVAEVRSRLAQRCGTLLTGPAGIGKTRVLQAIAAAEDLAVERITGSSATASIPLGALVRFLPDDLEAPEVLVALRAVHRALVATPDAVLGVDDADRLDSMSATVLADAVRDGASIIMCSRTAAFVTAPLLALLDEGLVAETPLGPLREPEAMSLVRAVAGAGVDAKAMRRAVALGEGNPLLLTELGRAAPRAGLEQLELTDRLCRAVAERLSGLPPPARRLVELLAYDAPLPLRLLAAVAGEPAVDRLESDGVVTVGPVPGHLATLAHPLMTEVVAQELTTARRASLAAELVHAIGDELADLPDHLVRHARWQVDAGDISSPQVLRDAARQMLARWDPEGASTLASMARRHLPDDPDLLLLLAGAAVVRQRYEEAEDYYATLDAHEGLSSPQRVQAVLGRAEAAYFGRGDAEQARQVLARALTDMPHAANQVAAMTAIIALLSGRFTEAEAAAARITDDAPTDVRLVAAAVGHVAVGSSGRLQEAWDMTEAALPLLADPAISPEHHFRFAAGRQYLRLHLGRFDEMRQQAQEESDADRLRAVSSDVALAYGELVAGQGDSIREYVRQANARLAETDLYGHRRFIGCIATELAALQGRRREALREAEAVATDPHPLVGWWAWTVPAAAAWAAAVDHRRDEARGLFRRAAATADGVGDNIHRCCCLLSALRLGMIDVAAELAAVAAPIDGRLWPAVTMAAQGLAGPRDADQRLEEGCAVLADIGATLWAVDLLAAGAQVDQRAGRPERAARRRAAAEGHAQRLVALSPPLLRTLRRGPQEKLTPRQREIAMLAADGLTSPEIAAQLILSVRTVDNHLIRVYQTLGIGTRRDLADGLGLPPR